MSKLAPVLEQIDAGLDDAVQRLFSFLRIPSISADPDYAGDCRTAAHWLVGELETIGFNVTFHETPGHPIVTARYVGPEGAPDILFYGHYDVQPVDPLELWDVDPFTPELRESEPGRVVITGRGSSDDKGQLMTFVEMCRAWKAVQGGLPCSITLLFEGEEESGSPSLKPFLETHAEELKADYAFVCDTDMWNRDTPSVRTSLRGHVAEEIIVTSASRDLHSGMYGGAVANPIRVVAGILGELHDATGRVTIPGFYDGVEETPDTILREWENLGETAETFLTPLQLSALAGEKNRSVLELIWARPTAEFTGIDGGYTGKGFKTVIPCSASAKVSFRLVQKQQPDEIRDAFRAFVRERLPVDCSVEFISHSNSPAIQLPYDSPLLKQARQALNDEWPSEAVVIGSGGSIPVVGHLRECLGLDSLLVGFALADDCVHSPNEKYDLNSFHKGQRSWARILARVCARGAVGEA